jgi:putative ABC transport system substrate-binding protein
VRSSIFLILLSVGLLSGVARAERCDVVVLRAGPEAPYKAALKGLLEALPQNRCVEQIVVDSVDTDGKEGPARRLLELQPRVLVPLGSQATRWAVAHSERTPIVFAMVLHPMQSGFVRSLDRPGGRVTGAALDIRPATSLRTLRKMLNARRIGVLYNPDETGSVIKLARRDARDAGVELVAVPVREPGELQGALEKLDGKVDALWSVPDRTVFAQGGVERVLLYTLEREIPFMGLSEQYVRAGALLALSTSLEENGRQAAERVIQILRNERPQNIPVGRPTDVEVVYNSHVAKRLEIRLPSAARSLSPYLERD